MSGDDPGPELDPDLARLFRRSSELADRLKRLAEVADAARRATAEAAHDAQRLQAAIERGPDGKPPPTGSATPSQTDVGSSPSATPGEPPRDAVLPP